MFSFGETCVSMEEDELEKLLLFDKSSELEEVAFLGFLHPRHLQLIQGNFFNVTGTSLA